MFRTIVLAAALAFGMAAQAATLDEAGALLGEGRADEAIVLLQEITAAEPDNAKAWNMLGSALNQTARYDEALVAAEKAVALDPAHFAYRLNRGLVYWEVGRFPDALADLDYAATQRPELGIVQTERGNMLAANDRFDEARTAWAHSLEVAPDYVWARYYRGVLAAATGDHPAAADDLAAVTAQQDFATAHIWHWVAAKRAGLTAPPLALSGEWPGHIGRFLIGEITAEQLRDEATRAALAIDARRLASAWYFIGQKHLIDGRPAEAAAAFRKALAIDAPRHFEQLGAAEELKRL